MNLKVDIYKFNLTIVMFVSIIFIPSHTIQKIPFKHLHTMTEFSS